MARTTTEVTCRVCGRGFPVEPSRLKQGRGKHCSRTCRDAAQTTRIARDCAYCGAPFVVHLSKIKDGNGRHCSRSCGGKGRPADTVLPRLAPRDGDARHARDNVARAIRRGDIPRASALPCVDCGHVWQLGGVLHDYDHHLGYGAAHHLAVEPVCRRCHDARTRSRAGREHFIRGWLACLESLGMAAPPREAIAESWERWILRSDDPTDDLAEAF